MFIPTYAPPDQLPDGHPLAATIVDALLSWLVVTIGPPRRSLRAVGRGYGSLEGEVIAGAYRRDDVPAGALIGLTVFAGTVEGRVRVIQDLAEADLEAGDILVTAYR